MAQPTTTSAFSWGLRDRRPDEIPVYSTAINGVSPTWAWGGSTGAGVRVCVVDSGVDGEHPLVGPIAGSYAVTERDGEPRVTQCPPTDGCGHGTACAGIIREVAPECELYSVRVLGDRFVGSGAALLTGLRWAVDQGFDVINMSLSTTREQFAPELREISDDAFFRGVAIVASAHNTPVVSFPWRFSAVISVGSHREDDADLFLYNPEPPVEFFAQGQNVSVAWPGGGTTRSTGNSFATPRIAGLCALILAKHPGLTVFQLKSVLYLAAANVHVKKNRGA